MCFWAIAETWTRGGGLLAGRNPATLAPKLEAALRRNKAVFAEGDNGEFLTTKAGHAPSTGQSQNTHTFKERLNTEAKALDAEAAKEYQSSLLSRTATRAERSAVL